MEPSKEQYSIGELYKLKEIYRCQGENVCWLTRDLIASILCRDINIDAALKEKLDKVIDAIDLFDGGNA